MKFESDGDLTNVDVGPARSAILVVRQVFSGQRKNSFVRIGYVVDGKSCFKKKLKRKFQSLRHKRGCEGCNGKVD